MSDITKPIVLDESYNRGVERIAEELHKIALGVGGETSKPSSWEDIRTLCRNGKIEEVLEVGEVVNVKIDGKDVPFAVMDFIEDNRLGSLKIHNDALKTGVIFQSVDIVYNLQFDAQEAFYYAEQGLAAGTYNFNIPTTYNSWESGAYSFTLAKDVPAGGQLCFNGYANSALTTLKVVSYASATSTTAIESAVISSGASGTPIGTLDGASCNHAQRASYGSNRWRDSAIRQQLNSTGAAGGVWTPQTKFDRPPSWLSSTGGFLARVEQGLVDCIAKCDVDTHTNSVTDGNSIDTTEDYVFLASRSECFFPAEGKDNGAAWAFYKDASQYESPNNGADLARVKVGVGGSPSYWWQRSPLVSYANFVRLVSTSGGSDNGSANGSHGCAPAFVIA